MSYVNRQNVENLLKLFNYNMQGSYCGMSRGKGLPIAQMEGHLTSQTLFEVEELEAYWQRLTSYKCPCNSCHGERCQTWTTIKKTFEI